MADIVQLGLSLDASKVLQARDKATRALDRIGASSKRTQASVSALQKGFGRLAAGAAAFIGFRQLTRGFQAMVEATKDGEQSAAKLNSVLRATEFAAGRTARQINVLSQAMADTTLFNDDEIRDLSAVLLTFRNVQGQVFDDAIGLIADMSVVLGTDLKSAALQVGKALNDPVSRLGDLSRAGITFTDQQKDMVRAMAEVGDMAGAQGVIIEELRNEFGGAAAGSQVGLFASINSTKKAWVDFLEVLGRSDFSQTVIGGFFDSLSGFLRSITPTTDELGLLTIQLEKFNQELQDIEDRDERMAGSDVFAARERELQAEIANLEEVRQAIIKQREEAEKAAEQAAANAQAASARETALALEREARLKAMQDQAQEFNAKQKALAAAWNKSWGRAIENTQDAFGDFFEGLLTDGVSSFKDFAAQILDVWIKMSAQIAATQLFQAFASTAIGQGLLSPGTPNLQEIPTELPKGLSPFGAPAPLIVQQTLSFNVSALDGASFSVFAEQHKDIIAGAAAAGVRDVAGLRRAFRGR